MQEDGKVVLAIRDCSVSYQLKEVYAVLFSLILKKIVILMESVNRTQNANSHSKINESTKVKIVGKKYNFNISEITGFIV
jgi:hypothetical protein